jgi:predicted NBD/HSP70 family sugar kinase
LAETRRIFGLSVDEELVWATANADRGDVTNVETYSKGLIEGVNLAEKLHGLLKEIGRKELNTFDGFGISSVGVVDSSQNQLVNIARKPWKREHKEYILDFEKLLSQYVGSLTSPRKRLLVQNDATSAALAELAAMRRHGSNCDRLLYLTINEGVNGGIAYYNRPLETRSHPELGHILAALRADDPAIYSNEEFDLNRHTGCPIHERCFEGVASGARIRRSWGGKDAPLSFTLKDLPPDHIAWDLEAFYIAQLCMIGALTISPQKIIVGGHVMNEELLFSIQARFASQNGNYFLPAYMLDDDLIQQSQYSKHANVRGALELARMVAFPIKGQELFSIARDR